MSSRGTWIPGVPAQFFTDAGAVAASHKLYTYAAGTTTNQATYSDIPLTAGNINANPIVLDSAGRATIFLNPALGAYKFVLKNADDSATLWTRDDVEPLALYGRATDVRGVNQATVAAGDFVYLLPSGTGDAGEWAPTNASSAAASTTPAIIGCAITGAAAEDGVLVRLNGVADNQSSLTAGSVYYLNTSDGAITTTAPANKRAVGIALSATELLLAPIEGAGQTTGPLPALDGSSVANLVTPVASVTSDQVSPAGAAGTSFYTIAVTSPSDVTDSNGDSYYGRFWGSFANNANNKEVSITLDGGGSVVTVLDMPTHAIAALTLWQIQLFVMRTGSTTWRSSAYIVGAPANTALTVRAAYTEDAGQFVLGNWNSFTFNFKATGTLEGDVTLNGGVLVYCHQS